MKPLKCVLRLKIWKIECMSMKLNGELSSYVYSEFNING